MREILIVDGYNVIFAWPELKALSKESLEHARLQLKDTLQNYGHHKGYLVILVFDGKYSLSNASIEELSPNFIQVFTADGETADSFIEKEVFQRKTKHNTIYVVTSDGAEQNQVLGSGGLRIPARELKRDIEIAKKEERRMYKGHHERHSMTIRRNELGSLLDEQVAAKLEEIRLNRGEKK